MLLGLPYTLDHRGVLNRSGVQVPICVRRHYLRLIIAATNIERKGNDVVRVRSSDDEGASHLELVVVDLPADGIEHRLSGGERGRVAEQTAGLLDAEHLAA